MMTHQASCEITVPNRISDRQSNQFSHLDHQCISACFLDLDLDTVPSAMTLAMTLDGATGTIKGYHWHVPRGITVLCFQSWHPKSADSSNGFFFAM